MHETAWTARWVTLSLLLLRLGAPNAAAESWTATSTINAPTARVDHSAVWTGSRMIVWGGRYGADSNPLNTGGIFDPATDTWTATSTTNAPLPRLYHSAFWTGSKMIVWGGLLGVSSYEATITGGLYDPVTDTWTATSTANAPLSRAYRTATAVWTGSKMIVWGGLQVGAGSGDYGSSYDPATDTWSPVSTTNAPSQRYSHVAVWTGSRMIVWGGTLVGGGATNTGGVYDPATDTWTATSTVNAQQTHQSTAVWTGSRMIALAGDGWGHVYDPTADTWNQSFDTPGIWSSATMVRMGSKVVVWGGIGYDEFYQSGPLNIGRIYDPVTHTVTPTTTMNAPPARFMHTAVWTGSRMIVWGGRAKTIWGYTEDSNTGGLYSPPGTEGPVVAGIERVFPLVPQCQIPDGIQALAVNLAVHEPTVTGNIRVYPARAPLPAVPAITYTAGLTRSNNAIVTPNVNGELAVRATPAGTTHFMLDVSGYFDSEGSFYTLTPCRAVDTRLP